MAHKSHEFKAYAQAAMYIQHIENLIEILTSIPTEANGMDVDSFKVRNLITQLKKMISNPVI